MDGPNKTKVSFDICDDWLVQTRYISHQPVKLIFALFQCKLKLGNILWLAWAPCGCKVNGHREDEQCTAYLSILMFVK